MGLIFHGDDSFQQSGPPQWQRSVFDFDTLRVPFQGGIDKLSAYLDSLEEFAPSAIDPNMFLQDFYPDNHKQFPTVTHVYAGRKGGVLPSGKHEDGDTVLSASSSSSGVIGSPILQSPVTVEYYAPRRSMTWLSRGEGVLGPSGDVSDPGGDPSLVAASGVLAYTIGLANPGSGYAVGSVVGFGDSCIGGSIQVTHVGVGNSIVTYNVLGVRVCNPAMINNPYPHTSTGAGAQFNVIPYTQYPITGIVGVRVISLTWLSAELATFGASLLAEILNTYFHPVILETTESEEIIPGQWWRNKKTKTRALQPGSIRFAQPPGGIQV